MGQNHENESLKTGRIALYGIALLILIAIPVSSHTLRVFLLSIISILSGITLFSWHRRKYSVDNDWSCQDTMGSQTLNCNRCGHLLGPSYMGSAGQLDGQALWKYICFNCGLRWDEYWHLPPHGGSIETTLGH